MNSNPSRSVKDIVLITSSYNLSKELSGIVNLVVQSVEDIPEFSPLKAVIVDNEYAKPLIDPSASYNPEFRLSCFNAGVNMVAHDCASLITAISTAVIPAGTSGGKFTCPYCNLGGLSEHELWFHCPTYHINWPSDVYVCKECPICEKTLKSPLQVHIHFKHGPFSKLSNNQREENNENTFTQIYGFSLVICRHPQTGRYLLCQEFADQGFWCPGGAVDPGETLTTAAKRETMEEAGIDIVLKGILGIEYNPVGPGRKENSQLVRMRTIFYAEPSTTGMNQLPKSLPDFESVGACWCTYNEIQHRIKLRGNEPQKWTRYIEEGGQIFPMSLLSEKGRHAS